MAPEDYHKKISQLFEHMDGITTMTDGIIVWASTKQEHDHKLRKVIDEAKGVNLKLNKKIFQFGVNRLTFIDLLTDSWYAQLPNKVHTRPLHKNITPQRAAE